MRQDQVAKGDETQDTTMLPAYKRLIKFKKEAKWQIYQHTQQRDDSLLTRVFLLAR